MTPVVGVMKRRMSPEQGLDLDVVEGRGRLVHDEHPGVEAQRLGDLDHLLPGDGEVTDEVGRFERETEPGQQLARLAGSARRRTGTRRPPAARVQCRCSARP
jgi:hypothetical protein